MYNTLSPPQITSANSVFNNLSNNQAFQYNKVEKISPPATLAPSCEVPQGFNSTWRCIRDGETVYGNATGKVEYYTFTINKCEVVNMIVPFEGPLVLGVSSEEPVFSTTLSMIIHSVNKPGSQSFAVCPRKKNEPLTLYFNAFSNNLAPGTKYWFHVTTRGISSLFALLCIIIARANC